MICEEIFELKVNFSLLTLSSDRVLTAPYWRNSAFP